jgi:hypothetical protein
MTERRFFTKKEKDDKSIECEMHACEVCKSKLEADHVLSWYKGGRTTEDNLLVLGVVCHALRHLMDEEYFACNLIIGRMTDEEKDQFLKIAESMSYPIPKKLRDG